ncbi:GumC family protein [Chachezhania sediminis]|uniref:GumC family protein n=1 Tax=Chachezhania sediminis TaxID=2599291 RepID=UPI001E332C5E|nr:polysaccharide biosynthesis tyrosine autokinase [Chachezhania sediminis]
MNISDRLAQKTPRVSAMKGPQEVGEADTIDLGSLSSVLWRGKYLVCAVMLLTTFLAGLYAYVLAVPLYQSTAVVMLNNRQEQVVDLESVIGGLGADSEAVNTEVEVLKSRSLLGRVVKKLDLTNDPEFNTLIAEPSFFEGLKQNVGRGVKTVLGIRAPQQPPLSPEAEARRHLETTINGLLERQTIRNVPQSLVFQITMQTESPAKSALVADTIADTYILDQLEAKFEATEQATSWLSDRVAELQVQLEAAEERVKTFRANIDLVSPEALQGLEVQLKETRDRIANVALSRDAAQDRLDGMSETGNEQTRMRLELDIRRASDQIVALETLQRQLESQIDQQSSDLIRLQQLTRESEASRLLYEYFLGRLKETSVQQGIQQADSRVLSDAVIPIMPSAPRKSLILAMGIFMGFLIGSALVLWREMMRDTFRTPSDMEFLTGHTSMGQIPLIPARKRKDAIAYLQQKPTSAVAEAIRNLRTSVLLSNIDHPPQLIMVTSSLPGEGKTTVSIALAQNIASMGRKTLLIEGDMRRRIFGEYFEVADKTGLSRILFDGVPLMEAVTKLENHDFDVLLADKSPANAADLLSSQKFRALLDEAREHYDQIVIDTPPVLVVPDARIVAQLADAVLFVVRWDKTLKGQVLAGLNEFDSANRPVDGLVMNQVNLRKMRSYGTYGGYGRYGRYGAYGAYGSYGSKYYNN